MKHDPISIASSDANHYRVCLRLACEFTELQPRPGRGD